MFALVMQIRSIDAKWIAASPRNLKDNKEDRHCDGSSRILAGEAPWDTGECMATERPRGGPGASKTIISGEKIIFVVWDPRSVQYTKGDDRTIPQTRQILRGK